MRQSCSDCGARRGRWSWPLLGTVAHRFLHDTNQIAVAKKAAAGLHHALGRGEPACDLDAIARSPAHRHLRLKDFGCCSSFWADAQDIAEAITQQYGALRQRQRRFISYCKV